MLAVGESMVETIGLTLIGFYVSLAESRSVMFSVSWVGNSSLPSWG